MTRQGSDPPLKSQLISPSFESTPPPATQPATAVGGVPALFPETLGSVASKSRDGSKITTISPILFTGNIGKPHSLTRSRSTTPTKSNGGTQGATRSNTPAAWRLPSESRLGLLQQTYPSPTIQVLNEKVHKYLYSMATLDSTEELAKENRSLHQRIAALQRTETDLLSENQSLAHKLTSVQKRHESRQKRWKEEVVKREDEFRACIKDLESRLAQKEEDLSRIAISRAGETTLGDIDVTSWLVTKGNTWSEWAHEFAHPDPNRIRPGLHPLHLRELCEGVKDFVRLTDNGEFPEELLAISDGDFRPAQLLLHGMLANFIVSETLGSPFWVFDVISADALELESPSVPRLNSISPIGFRMDLAMWNFNISPPREARSPRPVPAAERLTKPRNVCKLPRLVTSSQPSSSSLGSAIGSSNQSLPSRQTMESLYQFLLDLPSGEQNANSWRASVMKTFVEGGMSTEVDNFMLTKGTRIPLAESRLKYAGQLKDRFLRGPARFLLEDQEAAGIERLERHLVEELDAALRFSCQLWCGQDTPLIRGFRDLTGGTSNFDSNEMQAYQTQAPFHAKRVIGAVVNEQAACHGGHPVIMVLQPSVGTSTLSRTKVGALR